MSTCDEPDCECECHYESDDDDSEIDSNDEFAIVIKTIDAYLRPATKGIAYDKDHAKLISNSLEKIEDAIDGQPGDPGKLYPLHERVRRVIGVLQARAKQ